MYAVITSSGVVGALRAQYEDIADTLQCVLVTGEAPEVGDSAELVEGVWTFTSAPRPNPRDLKRAEIISACAAAIVGGFTSGALGAPHLYPSAITDQINLMGSVTGSLLPDLPSEWSTPFWCADGSGVWAFRAHTAAQIQQAGAAGKAHVVACQAALAELSAAVLAAPSEEALRQILWVDPPSAAAL